MAILKTADGRLIEVEIVFVTKDIALEWLKTSPKNRRMSRRFVKFVAEQMDEGEFLFNGETVIFDEEGKLMDGHHRLQGIVSSDAGIELLVVRGIKRSVYHTIDDGKKRTAADMLEISGVHEDSKYIASAARLVYMYYNGHIKDPGYYVSKQHIKTIVGLNPDIIFCTEKLKKSDIIKRTGSLVAGYCICRGIDPAMADEFFENVMRGEGIEKDFPEYTLRRWIVNTKLMKKSRRITEELAIVIKAWNAKKNRKAIGVLKWDYSAEFPVAI